MVYLIIVLMSAQILGSLSQPLWYGVCLLCFWLWIFFLFPLLGMCEYVRAKGWFCCAAIALHSEPTLKLSLYRWMCGRMEKHMHIVNEIYVFMTGWIIIQAYIYIYMRRSMSQIHWIHVYVTLTQRCMVHLIPSFKVPQKDQGANSASSLRPRLPKEHLPWRAGSGQTRMQSTGVYVQGLNQHSNYYIYTHTYIFPSLPKQLHSDQDSNPCLWPDHQPRYTRSLSSKSLRLDQYWVPWAATTCLERERERERERR